MAKFLHGVQLDIVCARGLLAADKGGTSDPFAKAILVEGDSGKDLDAYSFTTKTWRATLDPDWAETCVLGDKMKGLNTLAESILEVRVYDEDKGFAGTKKKEPLGKIRIPLKSLAGSLPVLLHLLTGPWSDERTCLSACPASPRLDDSHPFACRSKKDAEDRRMVCLGEDGQDDRSRRSLPRSRAPSLCCNPCNLCAVTPVTSVLQPL